MVHAWQWDLRFWLGREGALLVERARHCSILNKDNVEVYLCSLALILEQALLRSLCTRLSPGAALLGRHMGCL